MLTPFQLPSDVADSYSVSPVEPPTSALPVRTREGAAALEVLHVTEALGHGGAEQNLLTFLRHLPPERFRHHLAWMYDDDRLLDQFRPHVASLIPLRCGRKLGMLPGVARLARWIRLNQPDVVHTQLTRAMVLARSASGASRVPVVSSWQSAAYEERALADYGNSRWRRNLVRMLDRQSGRFDRHFIAVSQHVAQHYASQVGVGADRISVVYNAVDPYRYAPVAVEELAKTRSELGLDGISPVLLTVGRLVPGKAQVESVRALAGVRAKFPNARLLIAGSGPLHDELAAEARHLGLEGAVHLLGSRSDMPALYQICDLFVFPTHYEGLSVALLEALSNGMPAAVSGIPQNREIAEHLPSVKFFEVRDVQDQVAATLSVLSRLTAARTEAAAATEDLRRRFDPTLLAAQFGSVLENAAAAL